MFSWKARHDDHLASALEEAASYVHVESSHVVLPEDSISNEESSAEEGFDVLHIDTANGVRQMEPKEPDSVTEPDELEPRSSLLHSNIEGKGARTTNDKTRNHEQDGTSSTSSSNSKGSTSRSSGSSPHSRLRNTEGDTGRGRTGGEHHSTAKNITCRSGDPNSPRHLPRVWAALEAGRVRFRIGGSLTPSNERVPLMLNSKLFLRFNRTTNKQQLRDNLIVHVPNGPFFRLHFDPRLIALLPSTEPSWLFSSCAVVGNSGLLLNSQYGAEIDSREAVFRINYAPTHGYEQYVGSRTTFDVVNQQHTKVFVPEVQAGGHLPEAKRSAPRESIITVFEVDKPFASRHLYPPLLRRFNSATSKLRSRVAILSPDIVLHAHNVWRQVKTMIEDTAAHKPHYRNKPMSGFFAVILATQVCEHVHLYGVSPFRKGDRLYHYFDQTPAVTTSHSFDLAFEVFRQMAIWPCSDTKVTIHT